MSNISITRTNLKSVDRDFLAATITRSASKQTYFTIRFLADRDLIQDAFRAYAYFRWVDDQLDQDGIAKDERIAFVERQKALIERCYRGDPLRRPTAEEAMLVDLVRSDQEPNSGLGAYIRNLMAVMAFDAERRGRLISGEELNRYTRNLAVGVTEAMHYFIGHGSRSSSGATRYLAVTGAHITHMLRDTLEDVDAGYFNIPREMLHGSDPRDVQSAPYRNWIKNRVGLARACFKSGRDYLAQVENPRCRVAGFTYMTRFEGVLDIIEQDDYRLRSAYPECKTLTASMWMGWSAISQAFHSHRPGSALGVPSAR